MPREGDLVYFDYTWDANGNGRADDQLTHIAVVTRVEGDGTVELVHRGGGGIGPLRMNLHRPGEHKDGDRVLNSYLAAPGYSRRGKRLAGELWAGFASVGGPTDGAPAVAALRDAPAPTAGGAAQATPWVVQARPTGQRRGRIGYVRATSDGASWRYTRRGLPPLYTAERRLLRGRRVGDAGLWGSGCDELWYLRNAVYARHGYTFVTADARAAFAAEPWYGADPAVTTDTISGLLSRRDQANLERLAELERSAGCR